MKLFFSLACFLLVLFTACKKDDAVTVKITGPNHNAEPLTVRVVYVVPSDKALNADYVKAVLHCAADLKNWYAGKLNNGKTFRLNTQEVETLKSSHPAGWFDQQNSGSGDNRDFYFYTNAKNDVKALLGASYDENKYTYFVYVDAQGKTGAGALRFTAMPENDLLGLTGKMKEPVSRWIGGAGHELGHALGLPHPASQDPNALMWTGYTIYPNCILPASDIQLLNGNPFIR
ncbi:zinc metalloprotease [Niabella drilacis]|uniref:Matrixin n=1 Tax=Niabella drilacis (strain DSM 25811 / CCM 8410 / CCUG 62505 / LMG 26954 / E90) TaxID=1285928 RepID=A0A1G6N7Q3_NIADE|nr:hypothetical protein [Niabella drilacis]SDC63296.1 hypothetical protein SAMN04487894_103168 [Niabella drilacis]